VVPLHHRANEQITWITQGEAEVYSQGKKYVMHAGDMMIIPPNVPHEFRIHPGYDRYRFLLAAAARLHGRDGRLLLEGID
jgi:quercetin dioxygenase-like cupin family protein